MIILGIDTETTGLNTDEDHVIELGLALYSTKLDRLLGCQSWIVRTDKLITEEVTKITGLTQAAVDGGFGSKEVLKNLFNNLEKTNTLIGHNVVRFDKRIIESWCRREKLELPERLWADTRTDIPGVESATLTLMAANHGFLNLFPHSALTDVLTVLKIISMHDINKIVERAKQPTIAVKAEVTFDTNALAKKRKYRWSPTFKMWHKIMKEGDYETERKEAPFRTSLAKIPVEQLMYEN